MLNNFHLPQERWQPLGVVSRDCGVGKGYFLFDHDHELDALSKFLKKDDFKLKGVRDAPDYHVFLSAGFVGDQSVFEKTNWSLVIIQKEEGKVTYLRDTTKGF